MSVLLGEVIDGQHHMGSRKLSISGIRVDPLRQCLSWEVAQEFHRLRLHSQLLSMRAKATSRTSEFSFGPTQIKEWGGCTVPPFPRVRVAVVSSTRCHQICRYLTFVEA